LALASLVGIAAGVKGRLVENILADDDHRDLEDRGSDAASTVAVSSRGHFHSTEPASNLQVRHTDGAQLHGAGRGADFDGRYKFPCHNHWWCANEWKWEDFTPSFLRPSSRNTSQDESDHAKTYVGSETIGHDYGLVWADEFEKDGPLDETQWNTVESGGGFGNHAEQFYTERKDNAVIRNGSLFITAKLEEHKGHHYTSAKITTKKSWKYGKIVVRLRAKDAMANGTWGAVWMLPTQDAYGVWPKSGEIDVAEFVGFSPDRIFGSVQTLHFNHFENNQVGGSYRTNAAEWHNYTAEWKPDKVVFACDDVVYQVFRREAGNGTDSSKWPFDQPFYLILNLAVGGSWGGLSGIDEDALTKGQTVEVDFVRVYQTDL